jgi:hypothetical protein
MCAIYAFSLVVCTILSAKTQEDFCMRNSLPAALEVVMALRALVKTWEKRAGALSIFWVTFIFFILELLVAYGIWNILTSYWDLKTATFLYPSLFMAHNLKMIYTLGIFLLWFLTTIWTTFPDFLHYFSIFPSSFIAYSILLMTCINTSK